jgi:hypothetical protein
MANSFLTQVLENGPSNYIVKLTGVLDTSDLAATTAIDPSSFVDNDTGSGVLTATTVRIDHIDYSLTDQIEVQLQWDATTPVVALPVAGRGRMSFWNFGGLQNNAGAGKTGKLLIQTTGWTSGTQVFSIVLECKKQYR